MDDFLPDRHIFEWEESDVHNWLSNLGYPHYENQLREHRISGDVLCMLDAEGLKSIGVSTIGQRIGILKSIYQIKLAYNIPIEEDHYIPPSEAVERLENASATKLDTAIKDQSKRIYNLEQENRALRHDLHSFIEEFHNFRASIGRIASDDNSPPLHRQTSFKWENGFAKPQKSPVKVELESPHPSPNRTEHEISPSSKNMVQTSIVSASSIEKPRLQAEVPESVPLNNTVQASKAQKQESSDNLKSFKVSLEDPTWKVLPAALKKYRINNDTWQNYAMFICYGSTGNRIERCLSYDEKPLLLFQKLKDAKKNPVFMLKHIKDIRSPIAVAQQKHAARKASSIMTTESSATSATQGHNKMASASRLHSRPPKFEVQDFSTNTPESMPLGPRPGWPELSPAPAVENQRAEDLGPESAAIHSQAFVSTPNNSIMAASTSQLEKSSCVPDNSDALSKGTQPSRDIPVAVNGISYAVAIYPYMAEQEDEFDVVVGDTFIILSRARGWWVVQRDPSGSGVVETDIVKQGWVPAGCLLETNVPVASAIAEATAAKEEANPRSSPSPLTPASKTPILPLSIISTSFPGIALMDYQKKGEEELDLLKDEALRVFKRYNHWSYAVKEDGGDRGWVPSWFIGKVSNSGNPPTPSVPFHQGITSLTDDGQAQVSPMSSAFPTVHSRS